ncbi:flagellar hook-length control protein FliK [Maricaulis sp.]|uniref:flagellar hook-length control protein FliK n=1 Tax=Maricaulis sp. TaxID=1486257 RepID=UPI003A90565A
MSPNVPGTDVSMTANRTEAQKPASRSAAESGEPAFDALVGLAVAATTPSQPRPSAPPGGSQTADRGATDGLAGAGQPVAEASPPATPVPDAGATPEAATPAPAPGMTANAASPATAAPAMDPRGPATVPAATAASAEAAPATEPGLAHTAPAAPAVQTAEPDTKPASAKALADPAVSKAEAASPAMPATTAGATSTAAPVAAASGQAATRDSLTPGLDQAEPATASLATGTGGAAVSQSREAAAPDPRPAALPQGQAQVQAQAPAQGQSQAQSQTPNPAQPGIQAQPAAGPVEQAMPEPASLAGVKGEQPPVMATLSNTNPAQQPVAAASTAAAAVPPANPETAGRHAQARHNVDERESAVPAARSKGKSAAGQAGAASAQASGDKPQPQSAATGSSPAAPAPDTAVKTGEPALPQTAPLPALAAGSVRLPLASADPVMTVSTDTAAAAGKSGQSTTTDAASPNTPRFTPGAAAQLAAQISQRFSNGSRVFGIRLDPAELGRVDIRMELTQNNRVHATLTVERGDTLAELQRSTRDLERALNEAGLELAEDGLSFELGAGNGEQDPAEGHSGQSFNIYGPDDGDEQALAAELAAAPADTYGFRLSRRDSVDVRV